MSTTTKPAPSSPLKRPKPSWLKKNEKRWLPVATVVGIFAIWEIAGNMNLWDPLFFSHPSVIWEGFLSLTTGPLLSDLRVTGIEFLLGMMIALGIGVPVGIMLGTSKRLYWAFDPVVTALYSTPILVLTPLMVIWFGLGIGSKIANVAILAVFPVLINMMEGVRNTDRSLMRAAKSFGANGWAIQRDVIFPSVVPFFVTGLRLAIGKGMIAVVVGEYIAATEGIGYRIRADAEVFNTPRYLAGVLIMVVVSVIIMALIKVLERKLAPWRTPVLGD